MGDTIGRRVSSVFETRRSSDCRLSARGNIVTDGLSSESQVEYAETDTVVDLQDRVKRHLEEGDREAVLETLVDLRFIVDTGRSPETMTDQERESIRRELGEEYDDLDELGDALEHFEPGSIT